MLGKKSATNLPHSGTGKPVDTIDTLIGQKTVFKGDLEFSGGLRVDGQVKGNIIAREEAENSTLVLSELGQIEGNVDVPHVIVNGVIKGNIQSSGKVELQAKAQITGDVHYKAVEMELGATINGNLVCDSGATTATTLKAVEPQADSEEYGKINLNQ